MYIAPNTTIYLLNNTMLDSGYVNSIYFDSPSDQEAYFRSKIKYTLSKQSYQRMKRGYMKVQLRTDELYDVSYLMYQNTSFGNKWIYAFIKSVEYVNNETSRIEFEIDVIQTWLFQAHLEQCFVDREHSETDNKQDWIIEEKLNTGDYIHYTDPYELSLGQMQLVARVTQKIITQATGGQMIQGVFTPMWTTQHSADATGAEDLRQEIIGWNNQGYEPTQLFECPLCCLRATNEYSSVIVERPTRVNSYTPRNKKTLAYPYVQILLDNGRGTQATFNIDHFVDDNRGVFSVAGSYNPIPSVLVYPKNYEGLEYNYQSGVEISSFLSLAVDNDMYKEYQAQVAAKLDTNVVSAGLTVISDLTGSIFTGEGSGISRELLRSSTENVTALAGEGLRESTNAIESVGNNIASGYLKALESMAGSSPHEVGSSNAKTHTGASGIGYKLGFADNVKFYIRTITEAYAKAIDDFFTRYGYKTNRLKVPNRNVRPEYTYTKTIDCAITGNVPADDCRKIESIYNKGITFWKNGNNVGDFSVYNGVD